MKRLPNLLFATCLTTTAAATGCSLDQGDSFNASTGGKGDVSLNLDALSLNPTLLKVEEPPFKECKSCGTTDSGNPIVTKTIEVQLSAKLKNGAIVGPLVPLEKVSQFGERLGNTVEISIEFPRKGWGVLGSKKNKFLLATKDGSEWNQIETRYEPYNNDETPHKPLFESKISIEESDNKNWLVIRDGKSSPRTIMGLNRHSNLGVMLVPHHDDVEEGVKTEAKIKVTKFVIKPL